MLREVEEVLSWPAWVSGAVVDCLHL